MNKNTKDKRAFSRKISRRILSRFIVALVIVWAIVLIGFFAMVLLGGLFSWNYNSWFYNTIVVALSSNRGLLLIVGLAGSAVAVFLYYWRKTLGYLQDVTDATAAVYSKDGALITLPDELRDVETQLNDIKLVAASNERAAREAEQRKNDLIVYLAHDLKTPLTSVIGYLTLLKEESQISPALRERYLSVALDKAERLEELINEFFEITRFNLTALSLAPAQVNLTRMLEQLLSEFAPMMAEKSLAYSLDAPAGVTAEMDADKMQRVFDNILRNAVNYSGEGGEIVVRLTEAETALTVSFCNSGSTIPPDKLGRIFEQFYRLDAARSSRSGGAGLGLAIAKQITERHGGYIKAESADGTTTFTVMLPKKQP